MSQLEAKWLSLVPAQPWQNGGGVTRLLAERDGEWRISLANVDANGPYSRFEGMTRLSLIVEGKGVVLRAAERVVPLQYLVPTIYDGSIDWTASLIDAPVVALNIMARTDKYLPSAHLVDSEFILPAGSAAVILAGHSRCVVRGDRAGTAITIPPRQFLALPSVAETVRVIRDDRNPIGNHPPVVALIEPIQRTTKHI
ncbi:HutD family protein [Cupriavidus sp. NPDC089707]|uniref:HutD family protein n=1 Tax=Cupriavidus sp. NPDC089707 TaxID=3363963 RepID=UPI003803EAE1